MKWHEFVVPEAMIPELKSTDRDEAITELVDALVTAGAAPTELREELIEQIIEREKHGSTGFGKGVAVPHVKHESITQMAAAIGVGLPVHEPRGSMIVDIGGGTTEIAVIALSGIVNSQSVRLAGDKLTDDIIHYSRRTHNLLIGYRTAEQIKCEIGSAAPLDEELEMDVKGRDLVRGIPKTLRITSEDVRNAISQTVNLIVEAILGSLEQTPPELAGDILDHGIVLAGGGALLKNLDWRVAERTGLPVHIAEDPLTAVVRGTSAVLDDLEYYRAVLV